MKPEVIRYRHVDNIDESGKVLGLMGEKKFGKKFIGFVKETTWVHSEGFVTRILKPISGSPVKQFRKTIEEAGLVGTKF